MPRQNGEGGAQTEMETVFIPASGDVLGLILLTFMMYLIRHNDSIEKKDSENFLRVVILTAVITLLEIVSDWLNFAPQLRTRALSCVVNAAGFSLMFLLPVLLGMLYSEKVRRHKLLALVPAGLGTLLCVASIWTGWIFFVDDTGTYARGPYFALATLITASSYLILCYAHSQMAKRYDFSEKVYLWALFLIVISMQLVQVGIPKMEVAWGGIAMSELLYYVFLRELQFKYDAVTLVRNRTSFEQALACCRPNADLFLAEFDVNNLKSVNDAYGHPAGDRLLRRSAEILQSAYEDCGTVYRIGGDEFAVIAANSSELKMEHAHCRMMQMLREAQDADGHAYYIANAYCRYDSARHAGLRACLQEADRLMYADKKCSKTDLTGDYEIAVDSK